MIDNYGLWEMHDSEQEEQLKKLPVCCMCCEPIQQDTAVRIDSDWFCDDCLNSMREDTDIEEVGF